jgi:hypothetical protein
MTIVGLILLAASEGGRWRPGIGDPTVLGWVTVVAYLLAALVCGAAARREPMLDGTRRPRAHPSRFWLVLAGLMLALGINKQLDLQSLVTQIGRDTVRDLGLYSERRGLQLGFIFAVSLVCVGALAGFLWAARGKLKRRWLALAGMCFIVGFVMIRAASFHHVDIFLGERLGGLRWNWILELGGIAVVATAAIRILLAPPPVSLDRDRSALAMIYHYKVNSR